jgi:hypothetical protein
MVKRREFVIWSAAEATLLGLGRTDYVFAFEQVNVREVSEEVQFGDPELSPEILRYNETAVRKSLSRSSRALGIRKNPKTFGVRIVEVARTYLGISAVNEPDQVTDFLSVFPIEPRNNDGSLKPYCAAGVSYCACQAYCDISPRAVSYSGNRLAVFKDVLADINDYYFEPHCACQRIVENAKDRGIWQTGKGNSKPERGWLVFFDWTNSGKANHVGIVETVDSDGIHTIEFNTSSNSSGDERNGGAVARKCRTAKHVLGFVRTYQSG